LQVFTGRAYAAGAAETWQNDLASHGDFVVHANDFQRMSFLYEAYTSLDCVLVDTSAGLPVGERLDALLAWVRLGGTAIFFGKQRELLLEKQADWAAWTSGRFRLTPDDEGQARRGVRSWLVGQGRLILLDDSEPFSTSRGRALINEFVHDGDRSLDWVPSPDGSRVPAETGKGFFAKLPLRTLTALLVLFALVVGPVNFITVRRLKKPMLLLLTVPGIALLASGGLLAFGVFHQGLDVKSVSSSWTLLDQRADQSSSAEARTFFAGSTPGTGLRLGSGTSCYSEDLQAHWGRRPSSGHRMDYTEGTLLSGAFLPVRTPVREIFLVDRTARQKLVVKEESDCVVVENALSTTIRHLVLRDSRGRWFLHEGQLESGSTIRLEPSSEAEDDALMQGALWRIWRFRSSQVLPPGTYFAKTDAPPFLDDCGIEMREIAGTHVLVGVLDIGEEQG